MALGWPAFSRLFARNRAIVFPIKFGKICNFFPIFQVEVQLDPIDRYQYFVRLFS